MDIYIKNVAPVAEIPDDTKIPCSTGGTKAEVLTVAQLKEKVAGDIQLGTDDTLAAAWDGTSNERAVKQVGRKDLVDWKPFLIDHNDNAGEYTTPLGVLKRNNYLRFEDGSYAPVVGITPEMKAQTDAAVYRKVNGTLTKYCEAGAYDAVKFYETYGANEKLYDAKGTEIHALMPWETTRTDLSIMTGYNRPLYYIDNAKGRSGCYWKQVSTQPHIWDGINPVKLEPTAISPSAIYCIEDGGIIKTRCFFNLYAGLDKGYVHSKGSTGDGGTCSMFYGNGTYPTSNGINQVRNMEWARNNNADAKKSYPFAEGGFAYRDMFIAYLEMLYGRKDIHSASLFGNGISSTSPCSDETSWLKYGGVRFKKPTDKTWQYDTWATKPAGIYKDKSGGQAHWSAMTSNSFAKEQCMESQLAASWATEMNIPEGQRFTMYGNEYYWNNVPGALGILDGRMNVIVHKVAKGEANAFTKEGTAQKVTIEANLRMSLFEGVTLAGDIYTYFGGGYEVVGETSETSKGGSVGEKVDIYLQPNQKKWHSETTTSKSAKGRFDFEKTYIHVATDVTKDGYTLQTIPFTNFPLKLGGGLTSGDCYYFYNSNWWGYQTPGDRVRIGFRPRGVAASSYCAPRLAACIYTASATAATSGGSAQCLLPPAITD